MWGLLPPRRGPGRQRRDPRSGSPTRPGVRELDAQRGAAAHLLRPAARRPRGAEAGARRSRPPGPGAAGAGRAAGPGGDRAGAPPAAEGLAQAFVDQSELPDQIAIPGPGNHILIRAYALAECGRLAEARALATAAYEATPATAPPDARMWLAHQIGRVRAAGRAAGDRPALAGRGRGPGRGPRHRRSPVPGAVRPGRRRGRASGDSEAAQAAVRELDRLPEFPFTRPEQELGRAWAKVAAGDLPGARQVLLAAADRAAADGYRVCEAWMLHDVARLGEPAAVAARLAGSGRAVRGRPGRRVCRPRRGGRRR